MPSLTKLASVCSKTQSNFIRQSTKRQIEKLCCMSFLYGMRSKGVVLVLFTSAAPLHPCTGNESYVELLPMHMYQTDLQANQCVGTTRRTPCSWFSRLCNINKHLKVTRLEIFLTHTEKQAQKKTPHRFESIMSTAAPCSWKFSTNFYKKPFVRQFHV